jgi:hypothetical protein
MTTVDDAWVVPMTVLRPSSFGQGAARPRAALVVWFAGTVRLREVVLKGFLRRGRQLAAPPVGEVEFEDMPRAVVCLADGHVRVRDGDETVFDGRLPLNPDLSGGHLGPAGAGRG